MGDTFMVVIVIGLAVILMFVVPLMTMADRTDDVAQLTVSAATSDFVDNIRTTGKITPDEYDKFLQTLTSTGNTYDVEIELKILDENPGKKAVQVTKDKIGENYYYGVFDSQVKELLDADKTYPLKEGDRVNVKVKNTSLTLSQQLKNFLYTVVGNDTYTIAAQYSGTVTVNGK